MKTKLYMVGNNINTTPINTTTVFFTSFAKTSFDKHIIVNSFLSCNSVKFFLTKQSALDYAKSQAVRAFLITPFLTCPVVCEVEMVLKNSQYFYCATLLSAEICTTNTTSVNQLINFNMLDFNSTVNPSKIACTRANYEGDFKQLLNPISNFTFLCGNAIGLTPTGQNETYQLPNDITKEIGEYVVGHSFGKK